jgi:hypothetical protein
MVPIHYPTLKHLDAAVRVPYRRARRVPTMIFGQIQELDRERRGLRMGGSVTGVDLDR